MEDSLRQSISMGGGSLAILWSRPIALALMGAGFLTMVIILFGRYRRAKAEVHLGTEEN